MKEQTRGKEVRGRTIALLAAALLIACYGCGSVEPDPVSLTNSGAIQCRLCPSAPGSGLDGDGDTPLADNTTVLSWEAPIVSIDGMPLWDLGGYRVYFDNTSPLSKTSSLWIPVEGATFTLSNLEPGTYYFAVTAVDIAGNESNFSDEKSKTIL